MDHKKGRKRAGWEDGSTRRLSARLLHCFPQSSGRVFFVLPGSFGLLIFFFAALFGTTQQSQFVCEIISFLRLAFDSAEPKRRSTWRRGLSGVGFFLPCQLSGRARPTSAPAVRCNVSLERKQKTKKKYRRFSEDSDSLLGKAVVVQEGRGFTAKTCHCCLLIVTN